MSKTPVIAGKQLAAFDMSDVDRKGGLVESHFHIICIACSCKAYSCMSNETHPNANLPESTRNTSSISTAVPCVWNLLVPVTS